MVRHHLAALALVAAFALPLAASAQTVPAPPAGANPPAAGAPPAQHGHRHSHYLHALRSLNLTAGQQQQIAGFVKSTRLANANADQPTRRANARALRGQIEGVLSPAQRTQLHATLARERSNRAAHGTGAGAPQTRPQ